MAATEKYRFYGQLLGMCDADLVKRVSNERIKLFKIFTEDEARAIDHAEDLDRTYAPAFVRNRVRLSLPA